MAADSEGLLSREVLRRARQNGEMRLAGARLVALLFAAGAVAGFVPILEGDVRVVQLRAVWMLLGAAVWAAGVWWWVHRHQTSRPLSYLTSSADVLVVALVVFNWSSYPTEGVVPIQLKSAVGLGMFTSAVVLTGIRFDWRPVLLVTAEALAAYGALILWVLGSGHAELVASSRQAVRFDQLGLVDLAGRLILLAAIGGLVSYMVHRAEALVQQTGRLTSLKERLGQFVSSNVVAEIEAGRAELDLSGHRRRVAILFCDIRGFTAMSEAMEPEDLLALLNGYFERVGEIVFRHQGTLDKYVGDGVMALFGAPRPLDNPSLDAIRCAQEILEAASRLEGPQGPLRVGIGINTDEVVVGNLGTELYKNYTAIGSGVNLAARIEGRTGPADTPLLFSASVRDDLPPELEVREVGTFELKGVGGPVTLFTLTS